MNPTDIETWVDQAARLLDLPLHPGHRPGVIHYFTIASQMAAQVQGLPLGTHAQPGAVFHTVAAAADKGSST